VFIMEMPFFVFGLGAHSTLYAVCAYISFGLILEGLRIYIVWVCRVCPDHEGHAYISGLRIYPYENEMDSIVRQ
jgi:hypothetical protein